MIRISQPLITDREREAVLAVLDSGHLAQGEKVAELEAAWARLCGVRHAVAVSSGTAALHLALLAHGVEPGHEVITTPFSFVATANAILLAGAIPVFVDIEPDTFNIDATRIEAAITPKTRAILPVHLYGQPCDMGALTRIAGAHNLALIEDCAQAVGAEYEGWPVGSFGTGCFSLYATKNIMAGEGGIITTDNSAIADRLRLLRNQGQRERYQYECTGYNYRLTDLQAALALAQLEGLTYVTRRRQGNAAYLSEHISRPGIITPIVREGRTHAWHQYTVRFDGPEWHARSRRQAAIVALEAAGIEARVYYPKPLPWEPHLQGRCRAGNDTHAVDAAYSALSLPVHPGLNDDDLARIAREVNRL